MKRFPSFLPLALLFLAPPLACASASSAPSPARPAAPSSASFALPALGETVDLPTIEKICAHYGLSALWAKIERDPPPLPFKSDGASGWFNDWRGVSLYPAAFLHDLKYWAGYPGEDVERLVADAELMIDVARALNSVAMAETMFRGVRVGGTEHLRTTFSWGFGRREPKASPSTVHPSDTKSNP